MKPVVTPAAMAAIDAAAPEDLAELIGRAGRAIGIQALHMLGGAYGRRVVVVVGPGNNGADGRVAADFLERRGMTVTLFDAAGAPGELPAADLVIDAAYGTGLSREYVAPRPDPDSLVLAVDIPSGVNGLTGQWLGQPMTADVTITFAALKPGLLLTPGAETCGEVVVADIGLDVGQPDAGLVADSDIADSWPTAAVDHHKWKSACRIIAGGPEMAGAAVLVASAAFRAGASFVSLGVPGATGAGAPVEAVGLPLATEAWTLAALAGLDRYHAAAIGPGLGRDPATMAAAADFVNAAVCPLVIDADGISSITGAGLRARTAETIITPHDGEWARLVSREPQPPGLEPSNRVAETVAWAAHLNATILRKGPTTVIADPDGRVRFVTSGDARLATAGTGDVLTGIIVALLARGLSGIDAASFGAHLHGRAAQLGWREGMVASDLVSNIPAALAAIRGER